MFLQCTGLTNGSTLATAAAAEARKLSTQFPAWVCMLYAYVCMSDDVELVSVPMKARRWMDF